MNLPILTETLADRDRANFLWAVARIEAAHGASTQRCYGAGVEDGRWWNESADISRGRLYILLNPCYVFAMSGSVWAIEQDAEYVAWLTQVQDQHPRIERDGKYLKAGASTVGRVLLLAEERDGVLFVGVKLNTGDVFWKAASGSFPDLVQQVVAEGSFFPNLCGASDHFPRWEQEHGPAKQLEFCSSHVGGFVAAVMRDGTRFMIDEG